MVAFVEKVDKMVKIHPMITINEDKIRCFILHKKGYFVLSSFTMIDFRSDTVTRPTQLMLEAMMQAKIGDDVFGEDPSINELESLSASIFGMESALFCPSGTMTNQIAIKCHTQPGDEVICDVLSHVYLYEGGGIAANSGSSVRLLQGNRGRITAEMVKNAINPDDIHKPQTRLVSLENTANRGGGSCYNFNDIQLIREVCSTSGLGLHLDGARIFNALVAKSETAKQYGEVFDSISICLSKGLGAPVGSVLLGKSDFIKKARRVRKLYGGGMRQAGFLAAAGVFALQHHIDRLAQDHQHAKLIESTLKKKDFVGNILDVETNILIFEVKGKYTAPILTAILKEKGILAISISPTQIRFVLHLDVTPSQVQQTIDIIEML
jgi:threonine aldolase